MSLVSDISPQFVYRERPRARSDETRSRSARAQHVGDRLGARDVPFRTVSREYRSLGE
jgi:hypothetical protein